MKVKRSVSILFGLFLAGTVLILLTAWLLPQARSDAAPGETAPGQSPLGSKLLVVEALTEPLVVIPDPPMAHEPTEIRLFLDNSTDLELVRYAQFFWSEFGIGQERHPIGERIPFVLPPFGTGTAFVVWAPPTAGPLCFYVDVFETPDAPEPLAAFHHNMFYQAFPNPEGGLFTEAFLYRLRNPLDFAADISLELTTPITPTGWQVGLYPAQVNLQPGEIVSATVVFTYTPGLPPYPFEQIFELHAFAGEIPLGSLRKVFGPPLRLHLRPEPIYAESEISVFPYPIPPGEPAEICAEVRNVTLQPRQALVFFNVAPLGIGLSYTPIAPPVEIMIPELGLGRACVHWVETNPVPPSGGQFSFEVVVETPGLPQVVGSQRVLDVNELLLPGTISTLHIPVRNPTPEMLSISMGLIPHLPDWGFSLFPDLLIDMAPGETRWVTLTVDVPLGQMLLLDETPLVDVEAHSGGALIGGIRKVYRPPVPIHRPGEPIYAESEIIIRPYPPGDQEPTEICVEVRNPTPVDQIMTLDLRWADFGIGLPWDPIRTLGPVLVPANGMASPCTMWVPPHGGRFGFEVEVHIEGVEQSFFSQRVIDMGEILLPNQEEVFEFPVRNPFPYPVGITLGAIRYLPQWEVWFEPHQFTLEAGQVQAVLMHVIPVQRPGDPEPEEGMPVIDVEAWWDSGEAHGLLGGFRKLFFPPVPAHRPSDPVYAEGEIMIAPYPPRAGEPTDILVEVRNPTEAPQTITVTFEVGALGIGLPFNPIGSRVIALPPEGVGIAGIVWVPPFGGEFCVRVQLQLAGYNPVWSWRNVSIIRLPEPYGLPEVFPITIGDNGNQQRPLTITLGLIPHLPGWVAELSPSVIVLQPGQITATSVLTLTPPADPADLPRDGGPIVDVEAYANGSLVGGLRKVWRPPVPLGHLGEPTYAESEIVISPDPPAAGRPAVFSAQVRNNVDYTQTIHIQFGWADFGVGIPFSTTNIVPTQTVVTLGPWMTTTVSAQWTPPYSGYFCVQIILTEALTSIEQLSQRNVQVIELPEEPCEPFVVEFWLQNTTPLIITATIGVNALDLPPGWDYTVTPTQVVLAPYAGITITAVITPLCGLLALPLAVDEETGAGVPKLQVEGYNQDGVLLGGIEIQLTSAGSKRIYLPLIAR